MYPGWRHSLPTLRPTNANVGGGGGREAPSRAAAASPRAGQRRGSDAVFRLVPSCEGGRAP